MKKKTLWKDIRKSIAASKGRFFSIMSLIALGSFALVGLQVAGPDMRRTGADYFAQFHAADLTVIGDYGIDEENKKAIENISGADTIEYGYLKDVTITGTLTSIRVFSNTDTLSQYEVTEGRMPETEDEIALASYLADDYSIGGRISITEKEGSVGTTVLTHQTYRITGFVNSTELLSAINMGNSTAGTGELQGYGVVVPEAFDSDVYMLARISFADTKGVDPYSEEYTKCISAHKEELEMLLADQPEKRLEAVRTEYQQKIEDGQAEIDDAKRQLEDAEAKLADAKQTIDTSKAELVKEQESLSSMSESVKKQAMISVVLLEDQIALMEQQYESACSTYEERKEEAEQEIAEAELQLADAKETMDGLEPPVYAIDSRREIPGAEGYKIYGSVSDIIDALADVFPIFLYLVAALVTLTTMTRFVDEERMNCGTLQALGYGDRDILKKFAVYGWTASFIGAVIGITAGHIWIPKIVYNAYGAKFTYPEIELHFYPGITVLALLLAFISAVIPAYLVAYRALKEKPAELLLPKPPAAGSKILLERVCRLWNRMSFTHKVTARNIFRYKKRMLMTIFGVCGAVALLFAGLSVQHSISGVNDRQFGEIIRYDMIVAVESNLKEEEQTEVEEQLVSDAVSGSMPVVYEEMTKVAGENQDKQTIKLIVPEDADAFDAYMHLTNRESGGNLRLSEDGAVISERLAKLLNVGAGDTITVNDADQVLREITVDGITEMYTGHFIFMSDAYYQKAFEAAYTANAYLVTLKDRSLENANVQAGEFIKQSGVKGVVLNTTLINQIDTIVKSLNKIMDILILVALLLGVVILYNLTNINVSERVRELSTIKVLGFYDNEVTMYIYRETILLTVIGVIAGFGLGNLLYLYILDVVPPDEVMFNPALGAKAFLVPALVVAGITAVLGFVMNRKLQQIDMLGALKSVD